MSDWERCEASTPCKRALTARSVNISSAGERQPAALPNCVRRLTVCAAGTGRSLSAAGLALQHRRTYRRRKIAAAYLT